MFSIEFMDGSKASQLFSYELQKYWVGIGKERINSVDILVFDFVCFVNTHDL